MSNHTKIGGVIGLVVAVLGAAPSYAFVHLMQIEQVTGAVNGDKTAQAIQLRMRGPFETQTQFSQIRAWDAAVACSPKLDPVVLRVSTAQELGKEAHDEAEETQP